MALRKIFFDSSVRYIKKNSNSRSKQIMSKPGLIKKFQFLKNKVNKFNLFQQVNQTLEKNISQEQLKN